MKISFLFKLFIVFLVLISGSSVFSYYSLLYEQNELEEPYHFIVEKGESLHHIAARLKEENVINSISVLKVASRLSRKSTSIRAGEYKFPAKSSAKEILDILVSGQFVVRRVTIPEGKTSQQIFDMLLQTSGLTGDLGVPPENGTLLPETYTFSYGIPRSVIVDRMKEGAKKAIDELWETRKPDLPYQTKQEALVMASIIEKETAIPEERPHIASVFVNRLRQGMRLQTDPTVIYAVTNGTMELKRKLTISDLRFQHPFNTYTNKGLPPAPICNPSRDAIFAALNPIESNDIYFVADGTGGHTFSRTFAGHQQNIRSWKRVEAEKRGKGVKTSATAKPAVKKAKSTPHRKRSVKR
ncbi:MAG: endolytic transglycosylase MltG [Alphaproteobacteria bacterium]|nr:endolytic transglycosylase MltG [Alphaproteobacteria bacterium]